MPGRYTDCEMLQATYVICKVEGGHCADLLLHHNWSAASRQQKAGQRPVLGDEEPYSSC